MSFEINGPSSKPMIQEAQQMLNNGGGGNLGYFKRGQNQDSEQKKQNDISDFFETSPDEDEFSTRLEIKEDEKKFDFSFLKKWLHNLIKKLKKPFNRKKNPFINA